ncbi:molybdate ABC transporter substrate-binding protein [Thermococcus sp.]|uniref:molybdate ABC transporter substrate-binding protein n=1 Tax=Thermococcus sp. TaxID=35749 RepID=UPI0026270BDA|nr:molybdate ABC transporter substrate-binding protein [Thermococcus sp.]
MKGITALALVFVVLGAAVAAGCIASGGHQQEATKRFSGQTVVVCSGAGLMKPMNEIISLFENETGAKVEVRYGGSGEIFGILETSCGCDVFVPGSYYYLEEAAQRGYILNGTIINVTKHIPVIIVPKGNPAHVESLRDLAKPGVKVVLGDPKACAIGRVAEKILKNAGIWGNVSRNVIAYAPTVNQLLVYIATGQADAAIAWEDTVTWAQARGKVQVIPIPPDENSIKTIPTAVTVCARKDGHLTVAEALNEFIANHTSIWEEWGFKPWSG